jgi:hypothetical protein
MLKLAEEYAALKKTRVIEGAYKIVGKEITFVLESGPKLTMTESQLNLAINKIKTDAVGTVADGEPQPSAPSTAQSAETKTKKKKE